MCGIVGIFSSRETSPDVVRAMANTISHRGPDDSGIWSDPEAGVVLGHRRLAIIDLSPLGHQPMLSANGRWVLSYNGEIYNHLELRRELGAEGAAPEGGWRGHSDTETLLEAIAAWGLERALQATVGMFALALWDRRERRLQLARDRFGEKPLYYGWCAAGLAFGSELKALRATPGFDNPISRDAVGMLAARTYIPAPWSIYRRIYKLQPGCILTVDAIGALEPHDEPLAPGERSGGLSLTAYWSYRDVVERGAETFFSDEEEALWALDAALATAVSSQSVADVPVGAYLSGGIDSSSVVAFYQRQASGPIKTFSIGFEESGFDEAPHARAVSRHFGTEHHERYVTVAETRDVIPQLPAIYDEPFADSSQIPTYLVSRFAREHVTVALSGDGGDELFAGYNRHLATPALWGRIRHAPQQLRRAVGGALGRVPPGLWNTMFAGRGPSFGEKVRKGLRVAGGAQNLDDIYLSFLDEWSARPAPVPGGMGAGRFDIDPFPGADDLARITYCDAVAYLPDDILCKVDRAAMAVSLETRVPFLDHRVAAVAARIPSKMKVRGGVSKHVLRELLFRQAPRSLFERPKAGFAVPVGVWMRGPLREWAEHLLAPKRLAAGGFFDPAIVRARWQDHLSMRSDATPALWAVLMFEAWREAQQPMS